MSTLEDTLKLKSSALNANQELLIAHTIRTQHIRPQVVRSFLQLLAILDSTTQMKTASLFAAMSLRMAMKDVISYLALRSLSSRMILYVIVSVKSI